MGGSLCRRPHLQHRQCSFLQVESTLHPLHGCPVLQTEKVWDAGKKTTVGIELEMAGKEERDQYFYNDRWDSLAGTSRAQGGGELRMQAPAPAGSRAERERPVQCWGRLPPNHDAVHAAAVAGRTPTTAATRSSQSCWPLCC